MASSFSHPESVPDSSLKTRSRKAQEKSRIQPVLKFSKAEPLGLRVRGSTSKTRSERECSSPQSDVGSENVYSGSTRIEGNESEVHDSYLDNNSVVAVSRSLVEDAGGSLEVHLVSEESVCCEAAAVDSHEADEDLNEYRHAPTRKMRKFHFQEIWKEKYLMAPGELADTMVCMICGQQLTSLKDSTAKRHAIRNHKDYTTFTKEKKHEISRLFQQRQVQKRRQQESLHQDTDPSSLKVAASYKLAFTVAKYKMPLSYCDAMVEFAVAEDPNSDVFRSVTGSRGTVTRRTMDLHQKVLVPEVLKGVNDSHFWSLMVDDSTDTGTHEQMILYVRFIDSRLQSIVTRFLGVKRIEGHPNAENLCRSIMSVIGSEGSGYALPTDRLVSFTTDGASVMLSSHNGVLGKIRNEVGNAKLLSQHCCPHRLVLASKAGQHLLPDWIEKTVASAIDYFKGSPCRRDEFQKFLQLAEPGGEYR